MAIDLRGAKRSDHDAVAAFTRETWPEREAGDYIPEIFPEWIAPEDGKRKRTLVAEAEGSVAGVAQAVMLSAHEAWAQGLRVAPDHRGEGVARRLTAALFEWAAAEGASVARNMVFSWNTASLGLSRSIGFGPATEFRWAHPDPTEHDVSAEQRERADRAERVVTDPDAAWSYWTRSAARTHLSGLALDPRESWAVSELTRGDLREAAAETAVFAVREGETEDRTAATARTRGMAYRVRDFEREREGTVEHWAEYGVGAWDDLDAARALFRAIAADAAALGADRTRVLIPETPRHVTDAAAARAEPADEPDFVLEAELD